MSKAGFFCVMVLAVAFAGEARAGNEVCADLQSRLVSLEMADRRQWEGQGLAADPYAIERERLAVLKALAVNRCRSVVAKRDKRPNRLLAGLFGNKGPSGTEYSARAASSASGASATTSRSAHTGRSASGPVTATIFRSASPRAAHELQRDETACRALCPGQLVALYVQRNSGEEGGAMVSLAGEPYTALPAAFRYRSEYDRDCACGPVDPATAAAFRAFAVPPPSAAALMPGTETAGLLIPAPQARIREDDPDTTANRAGGFVAGPVRREAAGELVYGQGPDGKVVRLVGPASSYLEE